MKLLGRRVCFVLFSRSIKYTFWACGVFFFCGVLGNNCLVISLLQHYLSSWRKMEYQVYMWYTCVLGSKLIRHMWEVSLPDVGLSKSVRQKPKSMSQSEKYLLIGGGDKKPSHRIIFSSYILHVCKIFKKLKINNHIINKLFKLQVFVV